MARYGEYDHDPADDVQDGVEEWEATRIDFLNGEGEDPGSFGRWKAQNN